MITTRTVVELRRRLSVFLGCSMLSLRRYQEEALHELFVFWRNGGGNPLIAMATGTGKSVIIAFLVKQLLTNHPNMRVLITAPNRELIDQDVAELLAIWPGAPIGINCEGMGSRDTDAQILFALVNSIYRRPKDIGPRDLVIIDECFPAGTMIATPFGDRPIESLRPGDAVINATGIGFVEACRISQTTVLINLELTDGRIIRCTPNHPIFTDQGWCYAGKLAQGARVFSQQDLRELRRSLSPIWTGNAGASLEKAAVLFDLLCAEEREPDAGSCCGGTNGGYSTADWAQAEKAWRQRAGVYISTACDFELARQRLDTGVCGADIDTERKRLSHLLQSGCSQPEREDCYRVGRLFPFREETSCGSEERRPSYVVRVARVSVEECRRAKNVYNLQVTGHPSYYADGILVHNCHFIPHHEQGMYRTTIEVLRELVSDLRVFGLTATPYRLDSGHLCEGEGRIFDSIVYEYGIAEGIRDGWLSPLSSKATHSTIDVSGVGKRGGEFIAEQLEAAAIQGDIVVHACNEIAGYKGSRRAWLVYCVGIKHAGMVRDELRARGVDCEMVLGETPATERDRIIEDFRAGRLTALVSVMVLSYGFNVPHVDLIAMLRPTMSTGLYVQQVGRGTRKAEGKSECLILDFAGNVRYHGPVDAVEVQIDDRERTKGEAPVKVCPSCREIVMLAAKECLCCGHVFPGRDISHKPIADAVEILVSQRKRSDWLEVEDVHCAYHAKDPPSLRVSYQCGFESYRKWVCLEHQGWARIFAEKWWRQMTGGEQPPRTIDEALQRQDELLTVTHIQVAPAGKYWEITAYRVDEDGETREFDRNMNRVNVPPPPPPLINDEIPF